MERSSAHDFPEDLQEEIFMRLPPESLIRFKCVCKSWQARIGDPSFVAKHLNHAKKQSTSTVFMFLNSGEGTYQDCRLIDVDASGYTTDRDEIRYIATEDEFSLAPFPDRHEDYIVEAYHCDGLICVINYNSNIILCNPALRQCKILPDSHRGWHFEDRFDILVIGFGYDPVDDDYKIVRICKHDVAEIYSVRAGTWRDSETSTSVKSRLYSRSALSQKLHHQGVCYWLTVESRSMLLSFDLHTEASRAIPCPGRRTKNDGVLTVLNNSVAYVSGLGNPWIIRIHVWLMSGSVGAHGDARSWTKHLTIIPLEKLSGPIKMWTSDELLINTDGYSELVLFNLHTGKPRRLTIEGEPDTDDCCWFGFYVKTLLSIDTRRKYKFPLPLEGFHDTDLSLFFS